MKELTLKRVLINIAMMVGVMVAIAIAAHYFLRIGTRHNARRTVPEFTDISLSEAQKLAKDNDLKIYINDSLYVNSKSGGTVLDQLPAAGVEVKPGRTIYVVINAFGKRMVTIPYVAGRSLRQAKNMLDVAELEIKQIRYVKDMATNYVLSQSYAGKAISSGSSIEAPVGSGVELTVGVSEDDPYTRVPNVIGLSVKEAKSRIWESGLNVGRINTDKGVNLLEDKNAKVYKQGATANSSAKWGNVMSITVTLDDKKTDSASASARKADLEFEKEQAKKEAEEAEREEAEEDGFFE